MKVVERFGTLGVTPSDNTKNLNLSSQPLTTTNIVITGTSAGHTDPIDSFGLDIYQTVSVPSSVPEPGTLSLIGAGLIGISLSKRRRKPARKVDPQMVS